MAAAMAGRFTKRLRRESIAPAPGSIDGLASRPICRLPSTRNGSNLARHEKSGQMTIQGPHKRIDRCSRGLTVGIEFSPPEVVAVNTDCDQMPDDLAARMGKIFRPLPL